MSELVNLADWLTEEQAAAALTVVPRTLLRYVEAGKLEQRKRPRPGKKAENVYNPDDVARLQPQAHVMPEVVAEQPAPDRELAPPTAPPAFAAAFLQGIQTIVSLIQTNQTDSEKASAYENKLVVSLAEAAQYSGFSRRFLRAAIENGELPSIMDGKRRKIPKLALEQLAHKGAAKFAFHEQSFSLVYPRIGSAEKAAND